MKKYNLLPNSIPKDKCNDPDFGDSENREEDEGERTAAHKKTDDDAALRRRKRQQEKGHYVGK